MKKLILLASLFLVAKSTLIAQIKNPVSFEFTAVKKTATEYEVRITATIENSWHIYSSTTPAGGPVPTSIKFNSNPLVVLDGKIVEQGKLEQHHEKLFGVDVKQFSNKVAFVQKVKLSKPISTNVSGSIEFMVCNDAECLPPTKKEFSVKLK